MLKSERFGMRLDPQVKAAWEQAATEQGYSSLAAFITAATNEKAEASSE